MPINIRGYLYFTYALASPISVVPATIAGCNNKGCSLPCLCEVTVQDLVSGVILFQSWYWRSYSSSHFRRVNTPRCSRTCCPRTRVSDISASPHISATEPRARFDDGRHYGSLGTAIEAVITTVRPANRHDPEAAALSAPFEAAMVRRPPETTSKTASQVELVGRPMNQRVFPTTHLVQSLSGRLV
jgi:hypothetical protein